MRVEKKCFVFCQQNHILSPCEQSCICLIGGNDLVSDFTILRLELRNCSDVVVLFVFPFISTVLGHELTYFVITKRKAKSVAQKMKSSVYWSSWWTYLPSSESTFFNKSSYRCRAFPIFLWGWACTKTYHGQNNTEAKAFNFTFRPIGDVLSINNPLWWLDSINTQQRT